MEIGSQAPRSGYHHGHLRSALIEAGLAALAQGDGDISLRLLARQVGVTANAAYRHFDDKNDLFNAMAAEGFRRFAAGQAQARASVDEDAPGQDRGAERLRALGKAYIAFAQAHPVLFRLMFDRVATQPEHAELREAASQAQSFLTEATAGLIHAQPGDETSLVVAAACWGLVHGLSELAMGGQLATLGMDPQVLIDRVMAMPPMLKGMGPPKG